jgi:hypothetical protein
MRDLNQMLAHVHDAEIEISEGPVPPARSDLQSPLVTAWNAARSVFECTARWALRARATGRWCGGALIEGRLGGGQIARLSAARSSGLTRPRHRTPAIERHYLEQLAMSLSPMSALKRIPDSSRTSCQVRNVPRTEVVSVTRSPHRPATSMTPELSARSLWPP